MTLETVLLVLESVLLAFTILLLVMSIREGRKRDELINEVSRAVRVLSRHEYFITVVDSMMDAEREVIGCITGRKPMGEDKKRTREVVFNIEKLSKSGITVRYLLPKFQDRLHIGWLYTRAGAQVHYSACAAALLHFFKREMPGRSWRLPGHPPVFISIISSFCNDSILRKKRDEAILGEFNGFNQAELSKKYNLSEQQIRNILKKTP